MRTLCEGMCILTAWCSDHPSCIVEAVLKHYELHSGRAEAERAPRVVDVVRSTLPHQAYLKRLLSHINVIQDLPQITRGNDAGTGPEKEDLIFHTRFRNLKVIL